MPNCCDAELRTMVVAAINIQYETMVAICRRRSKRFARRRRARKTLELARSFAPGPKECCDRCRRRARRDRYK